MRILLTRAIKQLFLDRVFEAVVPVNLANISFELKEKQRKRTPASAKDKVAKSQ